MAESTLTLNVDGLYDAVTAYVYGGDGDYDGLTTPEQVVVQRIVNSGLRRFYSPPPIPNRVGRPVSHEWTFLSPIYQLVLNNPLSDGTIAYDHTGGVNERQVTLTGAIWPSWAADGMIDIDGTDFEVDQRISDTVITLTLENNPQEDIPAGTTFELHQDDYDLPDDFGYLYDGTATYTQISNAWWPCEVVPEARIREIRMRDYNQNFNTGEPLMLAVRPKRNTDNTTGQRNEMMFWPSITQQSTVQFRYRVRPDAVADKNNFPWGSSDHSETILQSCLAVAEERVDEESGIHAQTFLLYLNASIERDSRLSRAFSIGYNGDRSDNLGMTGHSRHRLYGVNSANGVNYKGQGS